MAGWSASVWVAVYGAGLSTLLGVVKGFELWRDRFKIEIESSFAFNAAQGHRVIIQNVSKRDVIISNYFLYVGKKRQKIFDIHEHSVSIGITYDDFKPVVVKSDGFVILNFRNSRHFPFTHEKGNGHALHIRLEIAGRRSVTRNLLSAKMGLRFLID